MQTDSLSAPKRTPLYEEHKILGGKLVPFAGWELPVQYSGIIAEHQQVRNHAGLFDVSHMGEIEVRGPQAEKLLQYLTCNDVAKMTDGRCQYNALINEHGGLVDDIIVYRYSAEHFFVCVNASNAEKDFEWIQKHNSLKCDVRNLSSQYGQLALQGPGAANILQRLFAQAAALKTFHFMECLFKGQPILIARTGYTGEDGFELFVPWSLTLDLWKSIFAVANAEELKPIGLGARDSLRLEAALSLYGHELGEDISAIESGLSWIVKPEKGPFLGCEILTKQKNEGAARSLVGLMVDDAGIVRASDKIFADEKSSSSIGYVTSGTKSPTLNYSIGLALVDSAYADLDVPLYVEVRARRIKCHVVKKPFYKRAT